MLSHGTMLLLDNVNEAIDELFLDCYRKHKLIFVG